MNMKHTTMIKVKLKRNLQGDELPNIPKYETSGAAGLDVQNMLNETTILKPLERKLFPTGLFVEVPKGYEIQVRPRSGLALKKGITVLNSPGTIDSDYRGEIGIILVNLSNEEVYIEPKERIAQLVLSKVETMTFELVKELSNTNRGEGGFGSTGLK